MDAARKISFDHTARDRRVWRISMWLKETESCLGAPEPDRTWTRQDLEAWVDQNSVAIATAAQEKIDAPESQKVTSSQSLEVT